LNIQYSPSQKNFILKRKFIIFKISENNIMIVEAAKVLWLNHFLGYFHLGYRALRKKRSLLGY
jgi:hypothetical protein